jgi:exoribonuclease R
VDWPQHALPGDVLSTLDRGNPRHVALIEHAAQLLRGSGYTAFDGSPPTQRDHAGIGAPYAHVTAPLRRLVDRFGTEVCLALHAGRPVPVEVRTTLPQLPNLMQHADHRAHEADRAVVDMTEAWLLRDRVGEVFPATVIDSEAHAGTIVIDDPAIRARCDGANLPIGERITARLRAADVTTRQVRFARA